ncbi:hypothetical protein AB0C51_16270 [Streptomyces pathocidini]|uniref:hypothetical protein n=1 Tax=Streptomyces pathocidini TaxID=1650571 RepID=UPI0033D670B6
MLHPDLADVAQPRALVALGVVALLTTVGFTASGALAPAADRHRPAPASSQRPTHTPGPAAHQSPPPPSDTRPGK